MSFATNFFKYFWPGKQKECNKKYLNPSYYLDRHENQLTLLPKL